MSFKIKDLFNFTYKELETVYSPINGEIKIYSVFNSPRMIIGGLLQSGGIVSEIWKKAAFKIKEKHKINHILILGLGCGTAAKIFSQKFDSIQITGIEIDKEVIRLGRKYFGLAEIPNLRIICEDAIKYVKRAKKQNLSFDWIVVDLYLGEKIPSRAESLNFLKTLKELTWFEGGVIFNRIFWDEYCRQAEEFVKKTEKVFPKISLVRVLANLLVIAST